jgi:hypothetical protein
VIVMMYLSRTYHVLGMTWGVLDAKP